MAQEPFATPTTAQPSPGLAVGEGHFYSDGFRPGDLKYAYGVLEQLLQQNPGWQLADGTVTLQDGSTPPDLRDRFIVGAGTTYALGDTGGSAELAAHTHEFTHEDAHAITQPVFAGPVGHTITQPVLADHAALATHTHELPFFKSAGVTGNFWMLPPSTFGTGSTRNSESAITPVTSGGTPVAVLISGATSGGTPNAHSFSTTLALSDNNPHAAPVQTTDVALSNNSPHSGGAVGDIAEANVEQLPPYAALYLLIKVS